MDTTFQGQNSLQNDSCIGMKDPASFLKILTDKYKCNFKLKGSGPIAFHLGCDFKIDAHGNLVCMAPKQYIERIVKQWICGDVWFDA